MTTPQQPSGLNTPPFGQPAGPEFQPTPPIGDYSGQDFPAPAGVPPLSSSGAYNAAPAASASGPYGTGYGAEPTIVQPWAGGAGPSAPAAPAPVGGTATLTRTKRPTGMIVAAAALSAVIGAGAGIGAYAVAGGGSVGSATSPVSVTGQPAANTPVLNGTVAAAAKQISPSVVTISVQSGQSGAIGTGVVLDTEGHILTNDHVVSEGATASQSQQQDPNQDPNQQGQQDPNQQDPNQQGQDQQGQDQQSGGAAASTISVTFDDGTTEKATVVGTSDTNDLAVIKVAASDKLVPAAFAKTETLQVGQSVVAVGAPLGLSDTVTSGIVSNTARPVRSGATNDAVYLALQTDAAINPGNSGGPLVNLNGDVVGINSSIASTGSSDSSGGQSGNIGIGFAIPSDVATRVANELIQTGSYKNAALGVTVGGDDSTAVSTEGVALQSVTADGAAAKAGLKEGDLVTKINDFSTTTADGLIAATRFYAPGTAVDLTYVRDGKAETVKVTLGTA